ncbi:hypothetical protein [Tsuneonella sp. SYSU-LHT278]|uniref:hypothetical protein n=1 Tax=Tsuneonella sediminis TaxID=3416089 RepID=UPI003F7AEF8C
MTGMAEKPTKNHRRLNDSRGREVAIVQDLTLYLISDPANDNQLITEVASVPTSLFPSASR